MARAWWLFITSFVVIVFLVAGFLFFIQKDNLGPYYKSCSGSAIVKIDNDNLDKKPTGVIAVGGSCYYNIDPSDIEKEQAVVVNNWNNSSCFCSAISSDDEESDESVQTDDNSGVGTSGNSSGVGISGGNGSRSTVVGIRDYTIKFHVIDTRADKEQDGYLTINKRGLGYSKEYQIDSPSGQDFPSLVTADYEYESKDSNLVKSGEYCATVNGREYCGASELDEIEQLPKARINAAFNMFLYEIDRLSYAQVESIQKRGSSNPDITLATTTKNILGIETICQTIDSPTMLKTYCVNHNGVTMYSIEESKTYSTYYEFDAEDYSEL